MSIFPASSEHHPALSIDTLPSWNLEEAKARFSEVIHRARGNDPQKITVGGQDAVVVLSVEDFAKLLPLMEQPNLHKLLSESPLKQLDFEQPSEQSPIRSVDL